MPKIPYVSKRLPPPIASKKVRLSALLIFGICTGAPLFIYSLVVLFAPNDIFDQYPRAGDWADSIHHWVLSFLPSWDIYRKARSTAFPQVAMLASSMAVVVTMATVGAWSIQTNWHFKEICPFEEYHGTPVKKRLGILICAPLFGLLCIFSMFCIGGDWSFARGLVTQSRIGFLFLSVGAILFAGFGFGSLIFNIRYLIFWQKFKFK